MQGNVDSRVAWACCKLGVTRGEDGSPESGGWLRCVVLWWAWVAVSGLKGMRTRFGLVQGLSVALTHGVVPVLIVGGWPYAIFSVTICRRV